MLREKFMPYCAVYIKFIYPAMKTLLARYLAKRGLSQVEVAKLLGVSQPLVNFYLKGRRGGKIVHLVESDEAIRDKLKTMADKLIERGDAIKELPCMLCVVSRRKYNELLDLLNVSKESIYTPACVIPEPDGGKPVGLSPLSILSGDPEG